MNEQKMFDASLKHLRVQGEQSLMLNGGTMCMYRGLKGKGCAFAPAIMEYDEQMESTSASEVLDQFNDNLYPRFRELEPAFADQLQACHDIIPPDVDFAKEFELNMKQLALTWKLEYVAQ